LLGKKEKPDFTVRFFYRRFILNDFSIKNRFDVLVVTSSRQQHLHGGIWERHLAA